LENPRDEFFAWQPGEKAQSTELEVILAFGKVDSQAIEAQTKLGLIQMASAGYEGVDVDAATKAGVWVGTAATTKTGNGESVAEVAVLLMLAASRRLNEELAFTHGLSPCWATHTIHPMQKTEVRHNASRGSQDVWSGNDAGCIALHKTSLWPN
jgi:lactate dehydrogenase-like 2-hydroxyacid dehydrogenase